MNKWTCLLHWPTGLPEEEEEGGTTSSHTPMSPYTTTSPHTTTSSHATSTQGDRDTRLDNQDFLDIRRVWFDKLQAELVEMRLSFDRSLRQMESRTHSLLWSISKRLERMTEAMERNSALSHQTKTYFSLRRLQSSGVSAVTPSRQPPGSRHTRGQRVRGGRRGNRSWKGTPLLVLLFLVLDENVCDVFIFIQSNFKCFWVFFSEVNWNEQAVVNFTFLG